MLALPMQHVMLVRIQLAVELALSMNSPILYKGIQRSDSILSVNTLPLFLLLGQKDGRKNYFQD